MNRPMYTRVNARIYASVSAKREAIMFRRARRGRRLTCVSLCAVFVISRHREVDRPARDVLR